MRYSFVFSTLAGISVSAAYHEVNLQHMTRDVDYNSRLNARNLDDVAINLVARASASKGSGVPYQRPAGGSGIGHSRLPISPPKFSGEPPGTISTNPPPPPPSLKISKTMPLGPAKERFGWPLPSIRDFQKGKAQVHKQGEATFENSLRKTEHGEQASKEAEGRTVSKTGVSGNPTPPLSSPVKSTKEEHRQYLTRPKVGRPTASIPHEEPNETSLRRGFGAGGLSSRPDSDKP